MEWRAGLERNEARAGTLDRAIPVGEGECMTSDIAVPKVDSRYFVPGIGKPVWEWRYFWSGNALPVGKSAFGTWEIVFPKVDGCCGRGDLRIPKLDWCCLISEIRLPKLGTRYVWSRNSGELERNGPSVCGGGMGRSDKNAASLPAGTLGKDRPYSVVWVSTAARREEKRRCGKQKSVVLQNIVGAAIARARPKAQPSCRPL